MKYGKGHNRILRSDAGTTLIEMVVAFALLGIFLVAASSIISTITGMFYHIKAETYSKQVSDIVLEKVSSEIEGAVWEDGSGDNLKILASEDIDEAKASASDADALEDEDQGECVVLFDKTDTKIMMYAEEGRLIVHYFDISRGSEHYNATDWTFSDSVYNDYSVKDLVFVHGDGEKLEDFLDTKITVNGKETTQGELYGLATTAEYGSDVVVVFLHIKSERYGDYYTYRFVRMYNVRD